MNRLNFIQVNRRDESVTAADQSKRQPSFIDSDLIDHVTERRHEGHSEGATIRFEDGQEWPVLDSFEDLSNRLPLNLVLKRVSATSRESLRVSINPSLLQSFEPTTHDYRGIVDGSRVSLRSGTRLYVHEGTSQIAERVAQIEQQRAKQRPAGY